MTFRASGAGPPAFYHQEVNRCSWRRGIRGHHIDHPGVEAPPGYWAFSENSQPVFRFVPGKGSAANPAMCRPAMSVRQTDLLEGNVARIGNLVPLFDQTSALLVSRRS